VFVITISSNRFETEKIEGYEKQDHTIHEGGKSPESSATPFGSRS
jgi:hypothetical protein